MAYLLLKQLHIACAVLSISGFALRGVLMLRDSPLFGARFARIALAVVSYLLSVAMTRNAAGYFSFFQ